MNFGVWRDVVGWVPWAWLWRRGLVLLLVGVVGVSFLVRERSQLRGSMPVERSSEVDFTALEEAEASPGLTTPGPVGGSSEEAAPDVPCVSPSPVPAPPPSPCPLDVLQETPQPCPDCPECPACPDCPSVPPPPPPPTCPPCPKPIRCPLPLLIEEKGAASPSPSPSRTSSTSSAVAAVPPEAPSCRPGPEALQKAYRRRLAKTLADLQRQISRLAGRRAVVDAKWSLVLRGLVQELDPHASSSSNVSWDFSARLPSSPPPSSASSPAPTPLRGRHVCPEVYLGRRYDHPYNQHGMETTNCTGVAPFRSVLTVLLPARSWASEDLGFIVARIRTLYDIPIVAIRAERPSEDQRDAGVRYLSAPANASDADLLNEAVKLVETPFVLLAESLAHFSNQSSLERLVRVLDDLDHVQVAGGAARDTQGHWSHGCLQQHMANYQAKYTMGYYHSKYECMYCDDLLTPFVTRTKLLHSLAFSAGLSGQAVYRDWFAKVRGAGHLAVLCPDVMFFVGGHVNMTADDWLPVARRWVLQKVTSFSGETFLFPCEDVGIKCTNIKAITKWYLLPPCCLDVAMEDVRVLVDFAEREGLEYELQAGSVLGALKFGSYLPWDMDHDVYVECKHFKKWTQKFGAIVKGRNCTPKVKYKNVFLKIICPSFTMDIFCRDALSRKFLPKEYADTPTSILYGGHWTKVTANPGLFARNSIGLEVLKHVQHSSHILNAQKRRGTSAAPVGRPGTWLRCKTPNHHACLDRFPADGNLPFVFP
ncbi:uncharacterized protein LOC119588827 [Penaeus monodon]|uniref:uncharacterized protein LOC119588827 n=1 Tax=Penaeus monodon TaxID=6687 RepID=UPI0018A70D66|nr:uncharacterized protein LOC119588827 [Penaeus monodon]